MTNNISNILDTALDEEGCIRRDLTSIDTILRIVDEGYDMPNAIRAFVMSLRDMQRAIDLSGFDGYDERGVGRAMAAVKRAFDYLAAAHDEWRAMNGIEGASTEANTRAREAWERLAERFPITENTNLGDKVMAKEPELQAVDPETTDNPPPIIGTTPPISGATPPNPFTPENLRLSQDFTETAGVKKLLNVIPVRRPGPQEWVRVHPDPKYRDNFPILELKDDQEEYIVTKELQLQLAGEYVVKSLCLTINRQGTISFWPIRLPGDDGKDMNWWRSSREAAAMAQKHWIRIKSNRNAGAYDTYTAEGITDKPVWPDMSFWDLIGIAFRDHLIDRIDHPVIKRLRGQG